MTELHNAHVQACAEYAATQDDEDIQRQTVAYRDAKVESTAHAAYWKKLDELEKWEALPETLPSEALVKEQRLATLRGELDALGAMLDTPAPPVAHTAPTEQQAAPVAIGGKKWTPENLAELKAYREAHTMKETADKYGISQQRIRQLLPSEKPKAKPFTGLIHRMK